MLDLASVDSQLAQLTHRRGSLPQIAQAAEIQQQIATVDARRIAAATQVQDLERDRVKADREVELVKTRRARDEERLNSGAVRNPKDLESLQHELTALERRIGTLEDVELEIMEQLESAQSELDAATAEIDELRARHDDLDTQITTQSAEIDAKLADVRAEREVLADRIPVVLIELYEKVRARSGGLGAAMLRAKRCEGCRLELNAADLREIAGQSEDAVVRCPECSRILVRTNESGL